MTLRSIEREFSAQLQKHLAETAPIDLTLDGPLVSRPHPKVLWAKLTLESNPEQEPPAVTIPGWSYRCFLDPGAAQAAYPEVALTFEGRPWAMWKFIQGGYGEAIVDFKELGAVYLSRGERSLPVGRELPDHLLPHWLGYALSPELWGPVGKWTRFHRRLHDLFQRRGLLRGDDFPGYYPLEASAEILERAGLVGTKLDKTYVLVLPWTFSSTTLEKLEEVISQEYPCLS
jgi:hypothetical protein